MDFGSMLQLRPTEIKTYHYETYSRISPESSKFNATGKTLFITGGATGIGYSICESFAKAGIARIVIVSRREAVLATAKEALEKAYPNTRVEIYAASQSDFPRMTEIIQLVGEIDVLIPCATSVGNLELLKDKGTDDMTDVFMVNVLGPFHMVREFLALPSTTSGGPKSVIHVSSNAAQMYWVTGSAYCSSKAAANQLISHFGFDDPEGNVKFYSFHPGAIWTPLSQARVPKEASRWEDAKLPGDFAVWLASPEAHFLNGRYVWAQWDVDELIALKNKVASDPSFLTISLAK